VHVQETFKQEKLLPRIQEAKQGNRAVYFGYFKTSCEVFDPSGAQARRKSSIHSMEVRQDALAGTSNGVTLHLTGSNFRDLSETGGGSRYSPACDTPFVRLIGLDRFLGQEWVLPSFDWQSGNSLKADLSVGLPSGGLYQVQVVTNGVAGHGMLLRLP
jgi:hypothetical protein